MADTALGSFLLLTPKLRSYVQCSTASGCWSVPAFFQSPVQTVSFVNWLLPTADDEQPSGEKSQCADSLPGIDLRCLMDWNRANLPQSEPDDADREQAQAW